MTRALRAFRTKKRNLFGKSHRGRVVETPTDCTVLVTTALKRTCKLLSAIGMGRPIVNPNWLTMSKAAGNFVDSSTQCLCLADTHEAGDGGKQGGHHVAMLWDPWQFLLKDREAEEKYGFCLEDTIKSAASFLLFEGLSMHATPSVQPPPCQMRGLASLDLRDANWHVPLLPRFRRFPAGSDAWQFTGLSISPEGFHAALPGGLLLIYPRWSTLSLSQVVYP
ncbi:Mediator of DNA damage checkpoint protein 1 [Chionoecetes opilio]|uniref:Mediator of DNA damage checkpoint protein 1 n=1 Tax=Chionoecetes opilio TaxID=41210 RepID=A0A8J5BV48_CHIOP|nr:Mediator of DNA damage checkpoint protein 1 [Chionoecetes opilio]